GGSRASFIRTSRSVPTPRRASARSSRRTRCSRNPRRASSTTATATPACGAAASPRAASTSATSPISSPPSSATTSSAAAAGGVAEQRCSECDGGGRVLEDRTLTVTIPAGIHDGQRIRISGEGHAGALGGRAGDVYVEVHVRPDERFVREGNDIFSTVQLTITQAALGASLSVPTLEGDLEIEFEPGTQPGEVVVLRGRGMPVLQGFGRGDQRVL